MSIVFIGTGKMATAIVKGVTEQGVHAPEEMVGVDISAEARTAFEEQTKVAVYGYQDVRIEQADVVVLAVKPQQLEEAVSRLPSLDEHQLVISILAGIPLDRLSAQLGCRRVVRVMPNTPMSIARGVIAFSGTEQVTAEDKAWVKEFFEPMGLVREVNEHMMDAVTALSGSGPAYVFEFIRGLTQAGVHQELPEELSRELAAQTVLGAAEMVKKGEGEPEELRDNVTSRGGTTAEGLAVLRDADMGGILDKAVTAARRRSEELGKQK